MSLKWHHSKFHIVDHSEECKKTKSLLAAGVLVARRDAASHAAASHAAVDRAAWRGSDCRPQRLGMRSPQSICSNAAAPSVSRQLVH